MRRAALLTLLLAPLAGAAATPFDRALYAALLEAHTRKVPDLAGTRVDYAALARSPRWRSLVASLERSDPSALAGRDERLAFWIDAYNVLAMDLMVEHHPVESIRDIGSFLRPVWRRTAGTIGGRGYSLDEIEHGILRPMGDPRIHAAVVCASTSCPDLRREPFEADRIDAQLDDAMRRFLADPRKGLAVEAERGRVRLSKIFDWFDEDFEAAGGVLPFVARHAPPEARAWIEAHPDADVVHFDYDWSSNGLR